MKPTLLLGAVLALITPPHQVVLAHGSHTAEDDHVSAVEPIAYGLPKGEVTITEAHGMRIVESNGIPDHRPGRFPNANNPNTIRAQHYRFEMPLEPVANARVKPTHGMEFGVARNGVKFDPGTAEAWRNDPASGWNMEAIVNGRGKLGLEDSNAQVQPTGAYHYHGIPNGLIAQLVGRRKMALLGWAADGFPIYGPCAYRDAADATSPVVAMKPSYRLKSGSRPGGRIGPGGRFDGTYTQDFEYVEGLGDLDEANGRKGVTPEFPGGTYYYVLTEQFPYVPRFFRGMPDPSFLKGEPGRGSPGGRRGLGGPSHRPPPFLPPPI